MLSNAQKIKNYAHKLGFMHCGIAKADFLEEEARQLESWLKEGKHGEMRYMENYFDKRTDPRLLVDGAESVISLCYNYFAENQQEDNTAPKISKYAYGQDYHHVIKAKLRELHDYIKDEIGEISARGFVDSAPVLDKAWAKRAGIGWIGKHSNLINKDTGSFFFLAELIVDIELDYDNEFKTDHCGTCTRCIDACPTDAIEKPFVVNGSKCISYFTIELKDDLPEEMAGKFENWMFGCDICQDVCPWNRFSKEHSEPLFQAHPDLLSMTKSEWKDLSHETFNEIFRKSAVKRTKYTGLKRNIDFLLKSDQ